MNGTAVEGSLIGRSGSHDMISLTGPFFLGFAFEYMGLGIVLILSINYFHSLRHQGSQEPSARFGPAVVAISLFFNIAQTAIDLYRGWHMFVLSFLDMATFAHPNLTFFLSPFFGLFPALITQIFLLRRITLFLSSLASLWPFLARKTVKYGFVTITSLGIALAFASGSANLIWLFTSSAVDVVLSLVLSLELYVFSLPTITSTHQAHVSRPGALHDADDPMEEDHLSRCPAPKFRKGGEKKVRGWKGNSTQAAEAVRRSWRLSQACLAWSMFGDDAAGGARERSRSRERNRSRAGGKKVEDVEEQRRDSEPHPLSPLLTSTTPQISQRQDLPPASPPLPPIPAHLLPRWPFSTFSDSAAGFRHSSHDNRDAQECPEYAHADANRHPTSASPPTRVHFRHLASTSSLALHRFETAPAGPMNWSILPKFKSKSTFGSDPVNSFRGVATSGETTRRRPHTATGGTVDSFKSGNVVQVYAPGPINGLEQDSRERVGAFGKVSVVSGPIPLPNVRVEVREVEEAVRRPGEARMMSFQDMLASEPGR